MGAFLTLPSSVHRAAIVGKVVCGMDTERALEGVVVTITRMPPGAKTISSAGGNRAVTAPDGFFCFADLPDGAYALSFALPGRRYGIATRDVTVTRDAKGDIAPAVQVVALPPTAVRGRVEGRAPGGSPMGLSLACVRVRGSGERAYTYADGGFTLAGLEPGPRALEISASGFQAAMAAASVVEGSLVEIAPIVLEPIT
jgi:hypothetical protein